MDKLKKEPSGRKAISPEQRLAITLRYLATRESVKSMAFLFRVGFETARRIILETCNALWDILQPVYMPEPTRTLWERSAEGYANRWQFPNCIGAVDGSVADYGSHSDGGVFKNCPIGQALENGRLDIPPPQLLAATAITLPCVFVGDEAFQLRPNFMRPYPAASLNRTRRIFNDRLSRARRCIENAFGILASRWRIFRRPICLHPDNAIKVVQACVVLHNYLLTEEDPTDTGSYCPSGSADMTAGSGQTIEGQWRTESRNNPPRALATMHRSSARNFCR
ncbi:uncharacterized protein LOC135372179 [Ornithodoros turicata]|uniref:uncharacterized protein LOC135372179 n=1 Tax=Ornithodoros turicata TaxID=34597 RepID=UPI003138D644